jgi:hypothetical protein
MNRDGDLAQLAVVPTSHKKDVKAFLQSLLEILHRNFEASGPELQAKFLRLQNACSDY